MFQTTRWSLILAARADVKDRRVALEELCRAYRTPVLAYVRRNVSSRDDAEDLTQAFFLQFLEQRFEADPKRGRFRVYLLAMVKHFLANARDRVNAAKRGGRMQQVDLDESDPALLGDPDESPERTFERVWALTVLDRALDRMRQKSIESGKVAMFDRLQEFLIESPEPEQYERAAADLGMRRHALAMTVHRLRDRLRERVRVELADTVSEPRAVDGELRVLRDVLAKS